MQKSRADHGVGIIQPGKHGGNIFGAVFQIRIDHHDMLAIAVSHPVEEGSAISKVLGVLHNVGDPCLSQQVDRRIGRSIVDENQARVGAGRAQSTQQIRDGRGLVACRDHDVRSSLYLLARLWHLVYSRAVPELYGVIPAAGRGVRAYPYTKTIPKSLLEVDGKSLLERNVVLLRDQLAIRKIAIVVGHLGEAIREHLGDGSRLGVEILYVENDRLELELAYSIHLGCSQFDGPCCVTLADECYAGTNHAELAGPHDALITCTWIEAEYPKHVRNNYEVELDGNRIKALREKPERVTSLQMGTGTYLVSPQAQRLLAATFADGAPGPGDWTTWIDRLARSGEQIGALCLHGRYVNVNSRNELNFANHLLRERSFEDRKTSLIYVCEGRDEAEALGIRPFVDRPEIAEVIVVAGRTTSSLDRVAQEEKVQVLIPEKPDAPLGEMLRLGMDSATGDILITTISDDTFSPADIPKLLVYLQDADLVTGTRTTRQMIEQGSNMRGIVRFAHLALAKLLEIFWWRLEPRFTDICCVYRGIWANTYRLIRDQLESPGVEIFPEMIIEVLRARKRVIEVPVNYFSRDLIHPHVRSRYQTPGTFLRVLRLMVRRRFDETRLLSAGRLQEGRPPV